MTGICNKDYIQNRDALIPEARKMAKRITKKLRPDLPATESSVVFAKAFSSAMDTLAFEAGITPVRPAKPFDFWEQESKRWEACGKALQK